MDSATQFIDTLVVVDGRADDHNAVADDWRACRVDRALPVVPYDAAVPGMHDVELEPFRQMLVLGKTQLMRGGFVRERDIGRGGGVGPVRQRHDHRAFVAKAGARPAAAGIEGDQPAIGGVHVDARGARGVARCHTRKRHAAADIVVGIADGDVELRIEAP
jgi:hypothetical protein